MPLGTDSREWLVYAVHPARNVRPQHYSDEDQSLDKLELVRYTFKDVLEHELARTIIPNASAVLIEECEAVSCIDLSRSSNGERQLTDCDALTDE